MISEVVNNIEKMRMTQGLTQEQMADILGVSRITYINIKNGKRDLTTANLQILAEYFDVPVVELFGQPRNVEKFRQMYFYILSHFQNGVPKTKLAKLLYLTDFSHFYDNLESMSGVRYIRRDHGPVADVFFEMTDDLFENGQIDIEVRGEAFMIHSTSVQGMHLLSEDDIGLIDKIVSYWKSKRTKEIVNFTHEQKPWKACRDGEYIPYSLIIQEEPNHVFAPTY
jgi:transcriptional regulator with XRE-family HTH domain